MPVRLRLARQGVCHVPFYSIVALRANKRTTARPIERLGSYDPVPRLKRPPTSSVLEPIPDARLQKSLVLNRDRVLYWLSVGAQPSDTVKGLLEKAGIALPVSNRKEREAAYRKRKNDGLHPSPSASAGELMQ